MSSLGSPKALAEFSYNGTAVETSEMTVATAPTAGDVLFAACAIHIQTGSNDTEITISDDLTNVGAWTRYMTAFVPATGNRDRIAVFVAVVSGTSSTGSITFTHNDAGTSVRRVAASLTHVNGANTTTPVVQSQVTTVTESGTTYAVDALAALGTGNKSFGWGAFFNVTTGNLTEGSDETLVHEVDSEGAPSNTVVSVIFGTDTVKNWTGLTDTWGKAGIALEIAAANPSNANRPGLLLGVGT